jgi:hypothetical protein
MPASLLSTDSVFRDEWKSLSRDSRLGGDPLGADCRQRLAQVGTRPFLFLKLTFQQSITRRTAPPAASCISALLHSDVACLIRPNRTKRRLPNQSVRVDKQQATHGVDLQRYNVPLSRGVFQSLRPPLRSLGPARARICRLETVWFLNHDQNIGPFSWGMTKAPSGTTEKTNRENGVGSAVEKLERAMGGMQVESRQCLVRESARFTMPPRVQDEGHSSPSADICRAPSRALPSLPRQTPPLPHRSKNLRRLTRVTNGSSDAHQSRDRVAPVIMLPMMLSE